MKPLSDKSRILIDSLYQRAGLVGRAFGRSSWNLEAIEQLGHSGEPAAIPYIKPVLYSGKRHEMLVAAKAIEALLSQVVLGDLPWLDEQMRRSWSDDTWRRLEPRDLAKWVGPGEPGILLLQLSSMHSNGFVRYEAVRRLALLHDGSELPYLLLRLNDWVVQVRHLAHSAILDRITPEYADWFVRDLTLVVRLKQARRGDQGEVLERITRLLVDSATGSMIETMATGPRDISRASFRMLTTHAPRVLPQILMSALEARDPVIRLWAAQSAPNGFDRERLRSVLVMLSRDPSAPVRKEALTAWAKFLPGEATEVLRAALLDRNASVRGEARFRLGEKGGMDFRGFYRNALAMSRTAELVAAIAGLAETGVPEDAKLLVSYLSHPLAKVRKTAVGLLLKLGGDNYLELAFDRVLDVSSGVSNRARNAVLRYAPRIGASRLWLLFSEPHERHVRRNLLKLLAALSKWESIICLVRATYDGDQSLAAMAHGHVDRWNSLYNRSQIAPTGEQLVQLESALSNAETSLSPSAVASIRFAIRSFGRG